MTWLQAIMRFLGGDAGTLSPDPSIAMTQITAYYNVHGTPPGLSSEQKATGRLEVEAAWMLTSSPLAGSDASVVGFRRTLKKLYADLGGDPNTL